MISIGYQNGTAGKWVIRFGQTTYCGALNISSIIFQEINSTKNLNLWLSPQPSGYVIYSNTSLRQEPFGCGFNKDLSSTRNIPLEFKV